MPLSCTTVFRAKRISRTTSYLLEVCLAQHRRSLNSPLKAPHVHSWMELFASHVLRAPDCAVGAELGLLPLDTLTTIARTWKANARAHRIHSIIDTCCVAKPQDESSCVPPPPSDRCSQHEAPPSTTAPMGTLSVKEALVTLWLVQTSLAVLSEAAGAGGVRSSTAAAGRLSISELDDALGRWVRLHAADLLEFFVLGDEAESDGLSRVACLRALHTSLYLLCSALSEELSSERCEAQLRGMFLAASACISTSADDLGNSEADFHARLREHFSDLVGNCVDGVKTTGLAVELQRLTESLRVPPSRCSKSGLGSVSSRGISLREPFPRDPQEQQQTAETVELMNAQLSAIATGTSP